jgi:hypothetical protein
MYTKVPPSGALLAVGSRRGDTQGGQPPHTAACDPEVAVQVRPHCRRSTERVRTAAYRATATAAGACASVGARRFGSLWPSCVALPDPCGAPSFQVQSTRNGPPFLGRHDRRRGRRRPRPGPPRRACRRHRRQKGSRRRRERTFWRCLRRDWRVHRSPLGRVRSRKGGDDVRTREGAEPTRGEVSRDRQLLIRLAREEADGAACYL